MYLCFKYTHCNDSWAANTSSIPDTIRIATMRLTEFSVDFKMSTNLRDEKKKKDVFCFFVFLLPLDTTVFSLHGNMHNHVGFDVTEIN